MTAAAKTTLCHVYCALAKPTSTASKQVKPGDLRYLGFGGQVGVLRVGDSEVVWWEILDLGAEAKSARPLLVPCAPTRRPPEMFEQVFQYIVKETFKQQFKQ